MAAPSLSRPIVIAHRGASGERPEHTLAAYDLAIAQGADVIEPDLVPTRDGHLVARHENNIADTTDVASLDRFADRRTTKTIDGVTTTGWFTEDFTLAEIRMLRAIERLPHLRPGSAAYDGRYKVPTLQQIIALAKQRSAETGRVIAIYPETKHPSYFDAIGHRLEGRLVVALRRAGWDSPDAPVFIQSFEVQNLMQLRFMTRNRLIQLLDATGGPADGARPSYAAMTTPEGLADIARYAWGIGPNKDMVQAGDAPATTLVQDAHAAGLRNHPWTFRAENRFLDARDRRGDVAAGHGDMTAAIMRQLEAGVDGFFTDFPLLGVRARDRFLAARGETGT